jgi:transposase-like protein
MAEMALKRGLLIHASCIWRWVQIYGPELDKCGRTHLKRTNKCCRVDETYIRMKEQDRYLYRAVDSTGQTINFLICGAICTVSITGLSLNCNETAL